MKCRYKAAAGEGKHHLKCCEMYGQDGSQDGRECCHLGKFEDFFFLTIIVLH